nr:thermonuclease family protein [Candidatus Gracilibacteria bacterium]
MLKKFISIILIYTISFSNISPLFADNLTIIPDLIISFQNPSYLTDKNQILDIYNCDSSKTECKVNFDLRDTFGGYIGTDFACENTFPFTTGEETNCNPNTIIFPTGTSEVRFKIYEVANPSNFKEKVINIVNTSIDSGLSQEGQNSFESGSTDTNSGTIDFTDTGSLDTISGSLTESGSVDFGSGNIDTSSGILDGSGTTDSNSGSLSELGTTSESGTFDNSINSKIQSSLEIPDVEIEIQSGLELIDGIYNCKNVECKLNLNLENLFTGTYSASNYACSWNFGSGTFTTIDTDKKCNPGYINYSTGNYVIEAKIYEKNNELNFKTGSLSFVNGIEIVTNYESGVLDGQDSIKNTETSSGGQLINFPEIKISFQNPSYLLDKNSELEEFICDTSKNDCKINFDLNESFSGFTSSNYECSIDFPFDSTEKEKCNPNTITFPVGKTEVNFKIYEITNPDNFTTKVIYINNTQHTLSLGGNNIGGGSFGGSSNYLIPQKEIILQSGASKDIYGNFICYDEKCKINLQYENSSNENCIWNFAGGEYKENYTSTCNPGYIYYLPGNYEVSLKIYRNGNLAEEKKVNIENRFKGENLENVKKPIAKINLQGIISKNKEISGNKLTCKNSETCSVNLTSEENDKNFTYLWDFGNGEFSDTSNPKSINYTPGKYKITLKITDKLGNSSFDYFYIEVFEKEQEVLTINSDILKYIQIIETLPNPVGKEDGEWIKIKNNSINFINIKGLEIDDVIGSGSKPYKITENTIILPYQEKKFYKTETKINLNNSFDEANLIYNGKVIDSLVWNYEVPEGFIVKKDKSREKVKVESVIDGDTIVIRFKDGTKEKLRLIGVDTPETKHPIKKVEFFGKEASEFTKNNLLGKEVELELDIDNYRDKYGRLLGYIWVENNLFNKLLIEKGYGRAYLYFPFKYSADFAKVEKEAKNNKLGVWGDEEVKNEMLNLEKYDEKEKDFKNLKKEENLKFEDIISKVSNLFEGNYNKTSTSNDEKQTFGLLNISFWQQEKLSEKELTKTFNLLLNDLQDGNPNPKIITYKTSKLKSGLKITGNTFPNSQITLIFEESELKTNSNETGNYIFLITDNLKVGQHNIQFLVSNGEENYNYEVPKTIDLTKEYIYDLQDYKVKQLNKKVTSKKTTTKNKLLAKGVTEKSLKFNIENTKNEVSNNETSDNKSIIIFLIMLLIGILGVVLINKID